MAKLVLSHLSKRPIVAAELFVYRGNLADHFVAIPARRIDMGYLDLVNQHIDWCGRRGDPIGRYHGKQPIVPRFEEREFIALFCGRLLHLLGTLDNIRDHTKQRFKCSVLLWIVQIDYVLGLHYNSTVKTIQPYISRDPDGICGLDRAKLPRSDMTTRPRDGWAYADCQIIIARHIICPTPVYHMIHPTIPVTRAY